MWIIPSLLSVIYWLWPACFHLYKGNGTRRFMYAKRLASRAPSEARRSFRKEASPRPAVPSSGQGCRRSPTCRAPTPSWRHCRRLCTCTGERGRGGGRWQPGAPFTPRSLPRLLCGNCSLAPALAFCSAPPIAGVLTGTQFSFGSHKKWKLKAARAADKALLKTGWARARDGVQGGGRSQDDCEAMGISQHWIIKKKKIFSICFFHPLRHWGNKIYTSKYQQTIFQLRYKRLFPAGNILASARRRQGEEAVITTPAKY